MRDSRLCDHFMFFEDSVTISGTTFCLLYAKSAPTFADTILIDGPGAYGGARDCLASQTCVTEKSFVGGELSHHFANSTVESCSQKCLM